MAIVFFVGLLCVWSFIGSWSIGTIEIINTVSPELIDGGKVKVFVPSTNMRYTSVYFFAMFWLWKGFIIGIGDMIFSYTIGIWYYTRNNDDLKLPIPRITKKILRYHLGTLIMHTFLNSFLAPIKIIL